MNNPRLMAMILVCSALQIVGGVVPAASLPQEDPEPGVSSLYVFLPKPVVVLVSQEIIENYVALRVRLKAYVLDTQYEKAFVSDVTLRVLEAFRDKDIQPPAILHRQMAEVEPGIPSDLKVAEGS